MTRFANAEVKLSAEILKEDKLKKKDLCPSKDYDFYIIKIPLRAFAKKQKTRFLNSELGKLHPCFSDDCCFDSHLKIERNGIKAEVVVMQKYKLAEFKNANKQRPVFVKENQRFGYFKNAGNKKKRKIMSAGFCIFVIFILTLFLKILRNKSNVSDGALKTPKTTENDISAFQENDPQKTVVSEFLDNVNSLGGKVSSLEWRLDGYTERINVSVKNVFPEAVEKLFPEAVFSPVVFENNIPVLNITIGSVLFTGQGQQVSVDNNFSSRPDELKSSLREFLVENQIRIIEENIKPFSLKLQFEKDRDKEKKQSQLITALFDYLYVNELYADYILISTSDNLTLNISFSSMQFSFQKNLYENLYKSLCRNIDVFFEKTASDYEFENAKKTLASDYSIRETKVGQVIHSDGTVIEFYKDENGKISGR